RSPGPGAGSRVRDRDRYLAVLDLALTSVSLTGPILAGAPAPVKSRGLHVQIRSFFAPSTLTVSMLDWDERLFVPRLGLNSAAPLLAKRGALLVGSLRGGPWPQPIVARTVHRNDCTGEEVPGGRGEVGNQPRELLLGAHPPKRDRVLDALHDRLGVLRQQSLHGSPGRAAMGHSGHAVVGGEGHAEHLSPTPRRDHGLGRHRMGNQPCALHIELYDRPEALRRNRLGGRQELATGIVYEQVHSTVRGKHLLDHSIDLVLLADVAHVHRNQPMRVEAGRLEQGLLTPTANRHVCPTAGQLQRRLTPQAAAAARHDRYLALEQRSREQTRAHYPQVPVLGLPRLHLAGGTRHILVVHACELTRWTTGKPAHRHGHAIAHEQRPIHRCLV